MNPRKKESAYLHLPTYAAGLMYHIGTAAAIVVFILLFLFNIKFGGSVKWVLFGLLSISGFCGIGILGKRLTLEKMRYLSNPDDYISNILVTLFHLVTLGVLVNQSVVPIYNFCVGLLLLYLPFGKLKHLLYFFAARYHLGLFYGWRGIWPVKRS
jgi:nitrate reductase gamma subunit